MRAETDLILRCVCPELVADTDDRIRELLQQNIDWDALLGLARLHGTEAPLASALDGYAEVVPPTFREQLQARIRENTELNRLLCSMLFDLMPRLEEIGVPMIPFKGPEMGVALYGSLEQRPFSDIDIFIEARDARAVIDLLTGHGYGLKYGGAWNEAEFRWNHGETMVSAESNREVDVHWDIMSYRAFGCKFRFDQLWERRTVVTLLDKQIPCPSLEDLFLILCVHGSKHRWILLKWIRDIAVLTDHESEIDWKALKRRASHMGATRMVELSLHLVHELLGVNPPEGALREFPANGTVRSLAGDIRAYLVAGMEYAPPGRERHQFYLRMRERLRDRIRFSLYLAKRSSDPTRWHVPLPAFFSLLFSVAWPFWLLKKRTVRLLTQVRSRLVRS